MAGADFVYQPPPGQISSTVIPVFESQKSKFWVGWQPLRTRLAAEQYSPTEAAADRARNEYRHPTQTLDFFGFEDGMTVLGNLGRVAARIPKFWHLPFATMASS